MLARQTRKVMFSILVQFCELVTSLIRVLKGYIDLLLGKSKDQIYFDSSGLSIVFDGNQDGKAVLGEGAFSTVFVGSAANSISTQKFAVKKMILQSEEFEGAFRQEVASLARFQHRNIITLLDSMTVPASQQASKLGYLLFPLMERGSLRDYLNRTVLALGTAEEGRGSVAISRHSSTAYLGRVLSDFLGIAEAFNLLHTFEPAPFVHQDVKPENILISENGTPLLCDFGSVRLANISVDSRARALQIADEAAQFCTVSYRAPELFDPPRGTQLDTRTDVWGIGCLLFAWWFGYSPYESTFSDTNGSIKVVDCSHSRVLSKMPRKPATFCTGNDIIVMNLVENILEHDFTKRCYTSDIIVAVEEKVRNLFHRGQAV